MNIVVKQVAHHWRAHIVSRPQNFEMGNNKNEAIGALITEQKKRLRIKIKMIRHKK